MLLLGSFHLNALSEEKVKLKAAGPEELFLYRAMGVSFFCKARNVGLEFNDALLIPAATYTEVLEGKHGGKIYGVSDERLSKDTLFKGAQNQLIIEAMNLCPNEVPEDIQEKVKKAIKENNKVKKRKAR